jgi:hypothetical protein
MMNELVCENNLDEKIAKLALRYEITYAELDIICSRFYGIKIDEKVTPGLKALNLVKLLKHVINLKMDKNDIDASLDFIVQQDPPEPDKTKARLVKGLFLTFLEHQHGLPGLVSTLSGIGRAGFGYGKFRVEGFFETFGIDKLKNHLVSENCIIDHQAAFFDKHLTTENLAAFPNVRIGVYCILTGCALLPFYAATVNMFDDQNKSEAEIIKEAENLVEKRFSPDSEKLQKFISMNLFRVIFEELFNYESTVYSIFSDL